MRVPKGSRKQVRVPIPKAFGKMVKTIGKQFPAMREAQCLGLSLWVWGAFKGQSACETSVIANLPWKTEQAARQLLRELLLNGVDKAAPCSTQVEVKAHFFWLMRWVISLWKSRSLPLAIDATLHKDRVAALVVSVLFRGIAIPVAWCIMPANKKGAWMGPILELLQLIKPAVPDCMKVVVMCDRGLWSRRLWGAIIALGWHPLMRVKKKTLFQPHGKRCGPAMELILGKGHIWVGAGKAFSDSHGQLPATLVMIWAAGQKEPWLLLTDLPPDEIDPSWYALRMWIESGFRALKSVGWRWERTRRIDPERVARYWLILGVLSLWSAAHGAAAEDQQNKTPRLNKNNTTAQRTMSVIRRGVGIIGYFIACQQLPPPPLMKPEEWPTLPSDMIWNRPILC